jgi:Protein tyrosine phosphatase-like protein, PTPLA
VNILSRIRSVVSLGRRAYSKTRPLQTSLPAPLQPIFARATTAYSRIGELTRFVQSFALLEVIHALLGWVRSPVTTTTMQVASRLFLVWGITTQFPEVGTLARTRYQHRLKQHRHTPTPSMPLWYLRGRSLKSSGTRFTLST